MQGTLVAKYGQTYMLKAGTKKDAKSVAVSLATAVLFVRASDGLESEYEYHLASGVQQACTFTRNGVPCTVNDLQIGDTVLMGGKPATTVTATH